MSASLREKILNAPDIKKETLAVEEWDVTVEVRGLSGEKMFEIKKGATLVEKNGDGEDVEVQDQAKLYSALLIASVYEPGTDTPVFQPADRDAISGKSFAALDKVATRAMRLSGLTKPEQKAIEKNSVATTSGVSISG
jgi:hypothetical protein